MDSGTHPAEYASTLFHAGLGRRVGIRSDSGTGFVSEFRYLWCGEDLCQARNTADAPVRRYFPEGEYRPLTKTPLYYARDRLGSVRDVLLLPSGARVAAYDYDPYGGPAQASALAAPDVRYGGLFALPEAGLYLRRGGERGRDHDSSESRLNPAQPPPAPSIASASCREAAPGPPATPLTITRPPRISVNLRIDRPKSGEHDPCGGVGVRGGVEHETSPVPHHWRRDDGRRGRAGNSGTGCPRLHRPDQRRAGSAL